MKKTIKFERDEGMYFSLAHDLIKTLKELRGTHIMSMSGYFDGDLENRTVYFMQRRNVVVDIVYESHRYQISLHGPKGSVSELEKILDDKHNLRGHTQKKRREAKAWRSASAPYGGYYSDGGTNLT